MKYTIHVPLSAKGIGNAIRFLENYADNLQSKVDRLVEILAEEGVKTAKLSAKGSFDNGVDYGDLILFESTDTEDGKACVVATSKQNLIRRWHSKGTIAEAEVSPLLMAEFGSGVYAKEPTVSAITAGRGTFPNQKHAFDEDGWFWVDEGGREVKRSKGVQPSEPMLHAFEAVVAKVDTAAKEAFRVNGN